MHNAYRSLISMTRPSKDQYYLDIAKGVAKRCTCLKAQLGAVIIRDDQIVSTGYNGAPRGTKSSIERGFCLRKQLGIPSGQRYEICRSVHAEQNAIINAARSGVSLLGGDIYIYGYSIDQDKPLDALPCFICKKMLINCGLKRCVCSTKDGGMMVFEIEKWAKDWSENDILDDKNQYGSGITAEEIKRQHSSIKSVKTGDALKSKKQKAKT
jgi:dCMP deaminase